MKPPPSPIHLIRWPMQWLSSWNKPMPIAPLVVFRMGFGLMMLISTVRFVSLGWIETHFVQPQIHFPYFGFGWVPYPGDVGIYLLHYLMLASAVGIMAGGLYRLSAFTFFLCFTWVELIDLTYYLNHYYFVSLVSFLMIWLPAHRDLSLDSWLWPSLKRVQIPAWPVRLLQVQLGIVYCYAGLAKLNYDWMINAQPLKIWLPAKDGMPLIGWLFRFEWTAYAFSWFGMLYDSLIPFFLAWRKTVWLAYIAVVIFHTMTGLLFQIGMFPIIMMLATWIFFPVDFHEKIVLNIKKLIYYFIKNNKSKQNFKTKNYVFNYQNNLWKFFVISYLIFQILFPWRYLLYPGNLFWTEEGYRFSWRVMLMEKAGTATFYVKNPDTGHEGVVVNSEFLNTHQEKQMAMQPDMILYFAHFLGRHYHQQGIPNPEIRAKAFVTLNGAGSRLLIDPTVNLLEQQDGWGHKDWILPFDSPTEMVKK